MTGSRWPILGLDGDATEAQIRRAYSARLRAQGPDAPVAQFAALRVEFEAALAHVRSLRPAAAESPSHSASENPIECDAAADLRASFAGSDFGGRARAVEEIRARISAGDLDAACGRYDMACAHGEIGFGAEIGIETELARAWLADERLSSQALAEIARRYRWDEVGSTFALAPQVVDRLRQAAVPPPKPGTRFIGQWNWGAFCLTPFWLFAHGRARRGLRVLVSGLILAVVPFGVLGVLWLAYTYGRRGNAIAVNARTFRDEQQFIAVQDAWRNWGLGVVLGTLTLVIAALVAVVGSSH